MSYENSLLFYKLLLREHSPIFLNENKHCGTSIKNLKKTQ